MMNILGNPSGRHESNFDAVENRLGVNLPEEVKELCSIYGDRLISGYIAVYGAESMVEKNVWMSDFVRGGHSTIPRVVLPDAGGMLHWGHSIEGDSFFLEDRGGGRWTVSAFRRNWHDWYESDEDVIDWLVDVFEGRHAADWMPEWSEVHWFE
ncbi:hypothetical protein [Streptomyces sp. S.PB5]|uniref:hypothetical protein n=1 Tax=Streptomyces sp. S.PB5 TaxID=3020844 RepID=UPI0025AF6C0A|nr:hypothetical protein [Streptomyces sp. S.PB5]MDN3020632.1 hypothetical protein [Streptomyces sp. S.PB5]